MIHWGNIFYFLHGLLGMIWKNSLRCRMVHDLLGKNLLFPSWLSEDYKEKLTEEQDGLAEEYGDGLAKEQEDGLTKDYGDGLMKEYVDGLAEEYVD